MSKKAKHGHKLLQNLVLDEQTWHNTHKNNTKKMLLLHCHTCSFPGIHERQLSKLTLLVCSSVVSPALALWTYDFPAGVTLWHLGMPSCYMVHTAGQSRHCDSGCHISGGRCSIWRWTISLILLPHTNSITNGDKLFHLFPQAQRTICSVARSIWATQIKILQNILDLATVFSQSLLNFSEKRHILLGHDWEKENNAALVLAVGKTLKQI